MTGTWLARYPNRPPDYRTDTYEKGEFQTFDVATWRYEAKYVHLHYEHLATKVQMPAVILNMISGRPMQQLTEAAALQAAAAAAGRKRREEMRLVAAAAIQQQPSGYGYERIGGDGVGKPLYERHAVGM